MASKLSLQEKFNRIRPQSASAKSSKIGDNLKKLQECGSFSLFRKSVASDEVEIEFDGGDRKQCDDSASVATDDELKSDANLQNNIMFDYMYGNSSESEGGSESEENDSEQFAVAPEQSELVLCCSEIKSQSTDGGSTSKNSEMFLAQRALHSVDLGKLMQTRCHASCKRNCIERVRLTAIGKLRSISILLYDTVTLLT